MPSAGMSKSSSQSTSASFVEREQAPFLDFLRNMAQGVTEGQFGYDGIGQVMRAGQGLFGQGQGMIQGLTDNPFLQMLQQQAGGNQQLVQDQSSMLAQNLGDQFNNIINPAIRGSAISAGQLGGGRQGVAQGMAAQGQQDALQQGILGFQQQDQQRAMQAAQAGGQLFGQGSQAGLSALGGQFNMMSNAFQSQFNPLMSMAAILGDPNVLNESQSSSKSSSYSAGM